MINIKEIKEYLLKENINFSYYGDDNLAIDGFSSLNNYKRNTITWCKNENAITNELGEGSLVVTKDDIINVFPNSIHVKDPKKVFFMILEAFWGEKNSGSHIGKNSYISDKVKLGSNVRIGHNCVLDGEITIGDNTTIYNNVSIINKVKIGQNCIIQSGTIIGHDDFSYVEDEKNVKTMIKHYGGVEIYDDVFIGANCMINRGTLDSTLIGKGTKIDANCHISHNCIVKENCAFVSGTRLYGSAQIGKNVYIASATIKNQLKVGDNTIIGMGSIVLNDIEDNVTVAGVPAKIIKYNK